MSPTTNGAGPANESPLTSFQIACRHQIEALLSQAGIEWVTRQVRGDSETYLVVETASTRRQRVAISIYADEAALFLAEEWNLAASDDPAQQAELLRSFVETLRARTVRPSDAV
jgi:hypothetical protein